jgi:hypothetical protein
MWMHLAGSSIRDRLVFDLGERRYGLLQMSCALLLERSEDLERFDMVQVALNKRQIKERREALRRWFAPDSSLYQWKALSEAAGITDVGKPFTWLDALARHDAYDVLLYRGYESVQSTDTAPELFLGAKTPGYKSMPKPLARIPAQRPQDRGPAPLKVQELDHNDFLIIANDDSSASSALVRAQQFLAFLLALRRSVIFASSLRERIYNIWLPPAVLTPNTQNNSWAGKVAVFPFVGLTRRPSSQAWRYVFTFNAIIAPTRCANGETNRMLTDAEVGALVACLDGPSMNPIRRKRDLPTYQEVHSWRKYTSHLLGSDLSRSLAAPFGSSEGTLRNWFELLFFSVARRQLVGSATNHKRSYREDRELADEVLRSIRTTSCWSVLLDAPKNLKPARPRDPSPPDGSSWHPKTGLGNLMACFDHLAVGPGRWFRPTDADRIDQGRVGERSWMAWAHPVRRCIVTFYMSQAEDFPVRSRLNLFAVFGHMIASLMTAREILVKLGHDVELYRDSKEAAERYRKYVIELEEMFDLDIAWTLYRRMYRRLRKLRGLDDMYLNVRDRTSILGQYYATLDEIKTETRRTNLAWAAAILAAAIIGLSVWLLLAPLNIREVWPPVIFAASTVGLAVIWGGWGRWNAIWRRPWAQWNRLRTRMRHP